MTYAGSIFDRLAGLDGLLSKAKGKNVLDVGCAEGLIAYEFAKAGAAYICAVEKDIKKAALAKKILTKTFVSHDIICTDIVSEFQMLTDKFDIVLYLGMQHHLEKQSQNTGELIRYLADICTQYFAVRTDRWASIEPLLFEKSFKPVSAHPPFNGVGALRVYEK